MIPDADEFEEMLNTTLPVYRVVVDQVGLLFYGGTILRTLDPESFNDEYNNYITTKTQGG